jgi:hypothetical protein
VHPDLFEGHAEEQRVNTESLKKLHQAVERLTQGQSAQHVELKFYYRDKAVAGAFQYACVRLTDSLVPLYEVFGVISPEEAEELRTNEAEDTRNLGDVNFLQWLESTIQVSLLRTLSDVVRVAGHESTPVPVSRASRCCWGCM